MHQGKQDTHLAPYTHTPPQLGVALLELILGFEFDNPSCLWRDQVWASVQSKIPNPSSGGKGGADNTLAALLLSCVGKNESERPTASGCASILEGSMETMGLSQEDGEREVRGVLCAERFEGLLPEATLEAHPYLSRRHAYKRHRFFEKQLAHAGDGSEQVAFL